MGRNLVMMVDSAAGLMIAEIRQHSQTMQSETPQL
jgi:hypothetical protein